MDIDGDSDILEEASDLESRFYDEGYRAGFEHGALHGLYEGRALGQEKAWELWEEVGYYEGWAGLWVEVLEGREAGPKGKEARALSHAKLLLKLISSFPTSNESDTPATLSSPSNTDSTSTPSEHRPSAAQVDLPALLSSIRARYRLLCTSLGVRPRLVAAGGGQSGQDAEGAGGGGAVVEGIEGPMKGVDTKQLLY